MTRLSLDLVNKKFNRLTVLNRVGSTYQSRSLWACKCDCGSNFVTRGSRLVAGETKSCGCLRTEKLTKHGASVHGEVTPEYRAWADLRNRCLSKTAPKYADYGGRGIKVCNSWNNFTQFLSDMGKRPSGLHSLDRIDNNKGYSPENCRWATAIEQSNNTRQNRYMTYNGEKKTVSQWMRHLGFSHWMEAFRFLKKQR